MYCCFGQVALYHSFASSIYTSVGCVSCVSNYTTTLQMSIWSPRLLMLADDIENSNISLLLTPDQYLPAYQSAAELFTQPKRCSGTIGTAAANVLQDTVSQLQ